MKKLTLSILIILASGSLFTSCNNPEQNTDKEIKDNAMSNVAPEIQKLLSLFKTDLPLPFIVDSAFLGKDHYGDSIGGSEMKLLSSNILKNDQLGSLDYDLNEFFKIDSIKAAGTYAAWCETLDIAMTKFSKAEAVGKIKYNNETDLLVWMLQQSSYEACPWSSFRSIYITPLHKNKIGQTVILGETFGAGDPPVSMQRNIYGAIYKDGSIVLDWREEHDDMDTTFSELEKRKYDLLIKDANISILKEFKKELVKIPHPKEEH
jgi:hypothetical protein